MTRSFSELAKLKTFEERYDYLKLDGVVAYQTFGYDRYLNQALYKSGRWKRVRDQIIIRDDGCDLGVQGREIYDKIVIHHMNPITVDDIALEKSYVFDSEFLICVSDNTHRAIHYGSETMLMQNPIERRKNDTCPWKEDLR